MLPLLPAAVVAIAGLVYVKSRSKKGVSTPERQLIFETAINNEKDPANLRSLAEVYKAEGLTAEADLLEKRAALRELPQDVKDARSAVYRDALTSDDPAYVLSLAKEFQKQGATGAATTLTNYHAGLLTAKNSVVQSHLRDLVANPPTSGVKADIT